jgi:hypothetical protein
MEENSIRRICLQMGENWRYFALCLKVFLLVTPFPILLHNPQTSFQILPMSLSGSLSSSSFCANTATIAQTRYDNHTANNLPDRIPKVMRTDLRTNS